MKYTHGTVILGGHASAEPINSIFRGNPYLITRLYSLKYKVTCVVHVSRSWISRYIFMCEENAHGCNVTIGMHDVIMLLSWAPHVYTQWHDHVLIKIQPVLYTESIKCICIQWQFHDILAVTLTYILMSNKLSRLIILF